jgi:hypothetical protein
LAYGNYIESDNLSQENAGQNVNQDRSQRQSVNQERKQ